MATKFFCQPRMVAMNDDLVASRHFVIVVCMSEYYVEYFLSAYNSPEDSHGRYNMMMLTSPRYFYPFVNRNAEECRWRFIQQLCDGRLACVLFPTPFFLCHISWYTSSRVLEPERHGWAYSIKDAYIVLLCNSTKFGFFSFLKAVSY